MIWSLLIPHIPHRHAQLCRLLQVLADQMRPGVEVVIDSDNLQASYGVKLQRLFDASSAEYVSSLANDDMVAPDFVPAVLQAMQSKPDQVGFRVRYTLDGVLQAPVIHSLRYSGWVNRPDLIWRDFMYYNPLRSELARRVRFLLERSQAVDVDRQWAADLRALGIVQSEVFIDQEMYYYQVSSQDQFETPRLPMPEPLPALPDYPFVRYIAR